MARRTGSVDAADDTHHGKTPPCSHAVIQAGISRVVIAMRDPSPHADGKGIAELEAAGIERAQRRLTEADLRIVVLDTSQSPHDDDRQLLKAWPDALVIGHKSDLSDVWGDELPPAALRVRPDKSSSRAEGLGDLGASF